MDIETIIKVAGFVGILAIVFAESGLLFGFFLPGDSLLFTAGFFASQGLFGLEIWTLSIGCFIAAVAGDSVGYTFGHHTGPRIFKHPDSLLFNRDHIEKARTFYAKYGNKTIVLARFLPVVRTFAPILAGVGRMPYRDFAAYNIIGGLLWAGGMTWAGYLLGNIIPGADRYLEVVVLLIILLSISPTLFHLLRNPQNRAKIRGFLGRRFKS